MDAKTKSAELERIERDIKRAEAELNRRMLAAIASGEATCLRAIVHEGENEDEVCARVRAEAGLPEDREVVFMLRVIVPMSDEFLQQQARYKTEADAIRDAHNAAEDEWRPPPRVMVADQLTPTQISATIDDELFIPIVGHYIVANGDVILTDARGKPLGDGRYARPLHPDARPDRIARSLLLAFEAERGKGEGPIIYPSLNLA
jgi:Arc/MetJ family transcription regulator